MVIGRGHSHWASKTSKCHRWNERVAADAVEQDFTRGERHEKARAGARGDGQTATHRGRRRGRGGEGPPTREAGRHRGGGTEGLLGGVVK